MGKLKDLVFGFQTPPRLPVSYLFLVSRFREAEPEYASYSKLYAGQWSQSPYPILTLKDRELCKINRPTVNFTSRSAPLRAIKLTILRMN